MKILPNHHAIFAEGNIPEAISFFKKGLEERGVRLEGNPDVIFVHYDSLGIDEARELIGMSLNAPMQEKKKVIMLTFGAITIQAQNALLKLFEDPNPSSEFLIASPNVNVLLPTLRSRLFLINFENKNPSQSAEIKKFLSLSLGEKLKETDKMLKGLKEDGGKALVVKFLMDLHHELEKKPKENSETLAASAKSLSYIDDKSSSVKILLESVILSL